MIHATAAGRPLPSAARICVRAAGAAAATERQCILILARSLQRSRGAVARCVQGLIGPMADSSGVPLV